MRAIRIIMACMLLLGIARTTYADQVILKNGDIISGTVVTKSGDTLTFNTSYAGDIKISWKEISTLSTDKPVATLLDDDSYLNSSLLPAESGAVRITVRSGKAGAQDATRRDDEDGSSFDEADIQNQAYGLNDILYINPTPEESGRGYRYSGRANLAISDTSGNSNYQQLHADAEIQKRARDWRYTVGGEANRAKDQDTTSVSNRRLYGSYDSFYTRTDFLYAHGSMEQDRFRDIRSRRVVGVGYGYQVYETETTKLSIKGGPDIVSVERYEAADEAFGALGWHVDFTHKLAHFSSVPIEIFHLQDGYRGFNSGGDILLKTRSGLRIPLSKDFVATAQYNLNWENNPAPDRSSTDRQLMVGIGYMFR